MRLVFWAVSFVIYFFSAAGFAQQQEDAEEEFEYKAVIKTVGGINFEVPEDRPIEKKDGIIAPMALDKYVALKIHRMEKRLNSLEESMKNIEKELISIKQDVKPPAATEPTSEF